MRSRHQDRIEAVMAESQRVRAQVEQACATMEEQIIRSREIVARIRRDRSALAAQSDAGRDDGS